MVRITEALIRKRSEHNEGVISTLEEVSLHQQDIERIENIDKWCRDLKILYLQSNLIPKIENVGRLKKLEYLNLALNNIERVENLEACESLKKLDLTVNFVGELTSLECLQDLCHFADLYLTGNPCTQYDGYREYIIATLPHLRWLDGTEIERSERIQAVQALPVIRPSILQQQELYRKKRELQKKESEQKEEKKTEKKNEENKAGFDGRWYTDINNTSDAGGDSRADSVEAEDEDDDDKEANEKYWQEKTAFTPESRNEVHAYMEKQRNKENKKNEDVTEKKPRRLQGDDGRIFNVNEAKVDFTLKDDEENNCLVLDVAMFRYMDTSLCDVDVQPTHVRVTLKGKVLQLALNEEVKPDSSSAKRSQTTGHLLITMPKMQEKICGRAQEKMREAEKAMAAKENQAPNNNRHERLEVDPSSAKSVDFGNIVSDSDSLVPKVPLLGARPVQPAQERANSEDFVDDPDVPPLV